MTWSHMGGGYLDSRTDESYIDPYPSRHIPKKLSKIEVLVGILFLGAVSYFGGKYTYEVFTRPPTPLVTMERGISSKEYGRFNDDREIWFKHANRTHAEEALRTIYGERYDKLIEYGKIHTR